MSDDTVSIEIDGTTLEARKGAMIIEVADAAGIRIPRFCYHKKLSIAANCRMCLVEVERAPKPLPACATPVGDGMKIKTDSELAVGSQRAVMEFLLINHPLDCPICDQGGECELQDVAMGYGAGVSRFHEGKRVVPDKDLGPLIATDMTRCIHCTRCVRFGTEIAGIPELGATGRGEDMRIGTFVEQSVDSELSGNSIDVCPVGALTSKPFRYRARSWEMMQRSTVAPHDGLGSNLNAHVLAGKVMRVVPRENESLNETWLSDRDRFSYEGLYHEERLARPRVKRDSGWEEVDWEVALDHVAAALRGLEGEDIGFLASPSATTEELYLLQKMARGVGSNHVDHRLRQLDFADQAELPLFPHLGVAVADLERVDAALLVASNLRKEQPLLNHRLRKAAMAGAAVTSVGGLGYEPNFPLRQAFNVHPSELGSTLAKILKALIDLAPARAEAAADLGPALDAVAPDAEHRAAAEQLQAAEDPLVLLGPGALAHPHASALRALAGTIATICGARFGSLAVGGNAAGAWLAGAVPHRGAGGAPLAAPGLDARAMLAEPRRAYVLLHTEPELDGADGALARRALDRAETVVALTAFVSEEMLAYADVLLPACPFAETPGSFVNAEGRWQSFDAVANPVGESRPAWRILRVLGNLLELDGFGYLRVGEIGEELRPMVPEAALDAAPDNLGAWRVPIEIASPTTDLWRWGSLPIYATDSLVRRSAPLQRTRDAARGRVARMSERTAARHGVAEAATVRVGQGEGSAELPLELDDAVAEGCVEIATGCRATAGLGPAFGPVVVSGAGGGGD